jgi:hypothetical protein
MDEMRRRFTSEDVTDIVRRALEARGSHDDVSYEDLEEIARQSGIAPGRLQAAIEEHETLGRLDEAKRVYKKRKRDEFFQHLRAYCIVNGALLLMNLITGPGTFWVVWPILGWGIGLAFHASDGLYPNEEEVEKGARKMLKKQDKMRASAVYDRI